jgi:FKBP-type peptidyl-prolyl cis-trans isomerase
MRSWFVLLGLGVALLTVALVVRSGMLMRANPGEPINAAMRRALAGVAYQWPEKDAALLATRYPGARETPNKARYTTTRPGTGDATPQKGQHITVDYTLSLLSSDQRRIDSSAENGGSFNFILGQPNVLPGWTDALHEIRKGERRTVILPYWLAYGEKGQRERIPPKASMVLEIELIDFR